jgi:hypothetical protein
VAAEISYLSAWQTTEEDPYPADPIRYTAEILGGQFSANTPYLILFSVAYSANDTSYGIDVRLELPDGTVKQRVTQFTDNNLDFKNFSGAVYCETGVSPSACRFRIEILTNQPTGTVRTDDAEIIAIDLTTGLRVGTDLFNTINSTVSGAIDNTYSSHVFCGLEIPATAESTDWLVLGTVSFESTVATTPTLHGVRLWDASGSQEIMLRQEMKKDSITAKALGTDHASLGVMGIIEGNTGNRSIQLQAIGDNDWKHTYSQLTLIKLSRFKHKIIDQGDHGDYIYSGYYDIVPMDGESLPSDGASLGQLYFWAAVMNASEGSGSNFETRDSVSTRLGLSTGAHYSSTGWTGTSNVFWVMVFHREEGVTTFFPNTRAERRNGSVSAADYKGLAMSVLLNPILADPIDLDMVIAVTYQPETNLSVLVADTNEQSTDLEVLVAGTNTKSVSLDMLISLVFDLSTDLEVLVAGTDQVAANMDIHLSGVEYLVASIQVMIAEHYEQAIANIDMAIADTTNLTTSLDIAITDAPHMVIEPDRPRYLNDIEVTDFQTTASPNGWYSSTKDFAALGVAKRDVVEISEGMNAGYYVVREVQGHTLITEQFINHQEAGPIQGAIRKERDLTAQLSAAVVLDQPMFMAGKSFYCLLDMLIQ